MDGSSICLQFEEERIGTGGPESPNAETSWLGMRSWWRSVGSSTHRGGRGMLVLKRGIPAVGAPTWHGRIVGGLGLDEPYHFDPCPGSAVAEERNEM